MKLHTTQRLLVATSIAICALQGHAADWSDTTLGARTGSTFAEPGINGESISKTIYSFTHVSGDKLGRNLVSGDLLQSDGSDPSVGGGGGAQEFYGLYRRSFSLSKISDKPMGFGPVKDINLVGRADMQTKNTQFAPRSRKVMTGVSVEFDVAKGYVEAGLYAYSETNHNGILGKDVSFDGTYMVDVTWMQPFNIGIPAAWRGTFSHTGPKGKDGFNADTKAESRLFTSVMFDIGSKTGLAVGVAAEVWRNKYGNNDVTTQGAKQNALQFVAEYHF